MVKLNSWGQLSIGPHTFVSARQYRQLPLAILSCRYEFHLPILGSERRAETFDATGTEAAGGSSKTYDLTPDPMAGERQRGEFPLRCRGRTDKGGQRTLLLAEDRSG